MGTLHLGIRGPAVSDVLVFKQAEGLDRHLIDLTRKAADPGAGRQLVEATHAVFLGQEPNEHGLHDWTSLARKYTTSPRVSQAGSPQEVRPTCWPSQRCGTVSVAL